MPKGKGSQKVRNHLTRVVVPIVGLLAVTTALALVGIAPILLFPPTKEAGPRQIAPSASSEVGTVAAPNLQPNGRSRPASPAHYPNEPGAASPTRAAPTAGPNQAQGSGTISQPQAPNVDQPDKVARQGDEPATDDEADQSKQKTKNGKALGHSKDKAKGKAKGHAKWQGQAPVAFPPRAAKPDHLHPASARDHSGRGHRPHTRARG
jgi:hypothetical protein